MALSTTTVTPTGWANDAAYSNWQKAQQVAGQPYQGYQGNMLAPWNAGQQNGYNAAVSGQGAGLGAMQAGQAAAQGAAAFQAPQITPYGEIAAAPQSWIGTSAASAGPAAQMSAAAMQAANAGPAAQMQAASAGPAAQMQAYQAALAQAKAAALARGDIRDVSAQNFTGADLSKYMNPYTGAVIDTTMNTLARQNDVLNQQTNARAAAAGAFGGSRQAVANSENNRGYLDTVASTTAGLNNTNFNQAVAAIQTDQNRDLQAQLANQSQDWNVGNLNTSNAQQTALQNMLAANQSNQYNATNKQNASQWNAGATNQQNQYNAGLRQQANMSNQSALNNMAQYNAGLTQQANQTNSGYQQSANASNQAATNNMAQYNASNQQRSNEASAAAQNTAGINNQAAYNNMAQFNADAALRAQMANQSAAGNAANTRLSAANALNGMGLDQQQQMLNAANASFNMGQAMTQHGQTQADIDYQQWMRAQGYPAQQLATLQGGLAGVPYGQTSSTPQYSNTGANVLAGVLGGGALLANGSNIVSGAKSLYNGGSALLDWLS